MKLCLLDTGPLVAFLDARDAQHARVADWLEAFDGRFLTTSAVVVEAMHLLGSTGRGPALLVEFLLESETEIAECTSPRILVAASELMAQYADTPADFADATLVLLGAERRVHRIATLDRRGFRAYRTPKGKAFELVLDE